MTPQSKLSRPTLLNQPVYSNWTSKKCPIHLPDWKKQTNKKTHYSNPCICSVSHCLQAGSTNRAEAWLYIKIETTSKPDSNIYCYCTIITTHSYILIHLLVNCCLFYACQIDNYCKVRICYTTNDQNWFGQKASQEYYLNKEQKSSKQTYFYSWKIILSSVFLLFRCQTCILNPC